MLGCVSILWYILSGCIWCLVKRIGHTKPCVAHVQRWFLGQVNYMWCMSCTVNPITLTLGTANQWQRVLVSVILGSVR